MKLYRIIPNTFTTNIGNNTDILGDLNYTGFEDLYYKIGYTSFKKNMLIDSNNKKSSANSFSYTPQAKFFFFYPDNAILAANQIIQNKNLFCSDYMLVEYDFPIEIVSKYIGIGIYFDNERYLEFLIPKTEFGFHNNNIDLKVEKEKVFNLSLIHSINSLSNQLSDCDKLLDSIYVMDILDQYENFFGKLDDIHLEEIIGTDMYKSFLENDSDIIKCPYSTNRFTYINSIDIYNMAINKISIESILYEKGFMIDKSLSKPDRFYEERLIDQIDFSDNINIQKVLLKERNR